MSMCVWLAGAAAGGCSPPVYLGLVDLCGGEDCVEQSRSALLAALEALPPEALFGLITFSNKVSASNSGSDVQHALSSQTYHKGNAMKVVNIL